MEQIAERTHMPARRMLTEICLTWLRESDAWVEIEQVCIGIANPSHESVRNALDKLVADGRVVKRIPRRRPGLRVTYRAVDADSIASGVRLELHWPHPIRRR
jgi:hypothetical protein